MSEWWDGDSDFLGTTLGLLAAWDGEVPASSEAVDSPDSHDSATCSSPSASIDSQTGAAPRRNINSTRERRKQELKFLRAKVISLQAKLHELRDRRDAQLRPHFVDEERTQFSTVVPVWENLATRQYQARKRSEVLNAKLKTMLSAQLRVAQDLIRTIQLAQQRSRDAGPILPPSAIDVSQSLSEEQQLAQLDVLCANWTNEIGRCDKFAADHRNSLQFLETQVVDVSENETVVEIFTSSVLPFSVARIEEAMWNLFQGEGGVDDEGESYMQEAKVIDDRIIGLFTATMTLEADGRGAMHGKVVSRRIHPSPTQTVLISHCQFEPQGFSHQLDGVTTFEESWVRLIDVKELGHTQVQGTLTAIQHMRRERIVMRPIGDVEPSRSRMEAVTQVITTRIRDEINCMQHLIEDALIRGATSC